jgi:hypothetical protein
MIWPLVAIGFGWFLCLMLLLALCGAASWADEELAERADHPTALKPPRARHEEDEIPQRWMRNG